MSRLPLEYHLHAQGCVPPCTCDCAGCVKGLCSIALDGWIAARARGLWQIQAAMGSAHRSASSQRQVLKHFHEFTGGYGEARASNARLRELSRERRKLVRESRAAERKVASETVMPEWE